MSTPHTESEEKQQEVSATTVTNDNVTDKYNLNTKFAVKFIRKGKSEKRRIETMNLKDFLKIYPEIKSTAKYHGDIPQNFNWDDVTSNQVHHCIERMFKDMKEDKETGTKYISGSNAGKVISTILYPHSYTNPILILDSFSHIKYINT